MIFFKLYTRVKIGNLRGLSSPEFLGYSRGDATTLRVTAEGILPLPVQYVREGILPLCGLQQGGYCHCLSVRADSLTLWVTSEGILLLYVCQRGDTVTVCLSERGYCQSVGYTVLYKSSLSSNMKYITNRWYWRFCPRVYILTSHI